MQHSTKKVGGILWAYETENFLPQLDMKRTWNGHETHYETKHAIINPNKDVDDKS